MQKIFFACLQLYIVIVNMQNTFFFVAFVNPVASVY